MSEIEKVQKNRRQDEADKDGFFVAIAISQGASRHNPNASGKQENGEIFPYAHGVPVQNIYKIEFLDQDEITIDEIIKYEIEGNISIERKNGMRRTCNLTLDNSSGRFTPSSSGLISISNRVKIYTGLKIDNISQTPPSIAVPHHD